MWADRHRGWVVAGLVLAGLAVAPVVRAEKRPSDEVRGRELYDRHCLPCHGPEAAGDGPGAASLVRPVPDLRPRLVEENREAFIRVVLDGSGAMPGYSLAFDKYDAKRVMKHMERAARGEAEPVEAEATPEAASGAAPEPEEEAGGGG
jgi:mono/diheme cytochrome c family protein